MHLLLFSWQICITCTADDGGFNQLDTANFIPWCSSMAMLFRKALCDSTALLLRLLSAKQLICTRCFMSILIYWYADWSKNRRDRGLCKYCVYNNVLFLLDIQISRPNQRLQHAPYAQKFDSNDFAFLQNLSIYSRSREMC